MPLSHSQHLIVVTSHEFTHPAHFFRHYMSLWFFDHCGISPRY